MYIFYIGITFLFLLFISYLIFRLKKISMNEKNPIDDIVYKMKDLLPENRKINYGVVSYYHHTVIPKVFQALYKGLLGNYLKNLNFINIDWDPQKAISLYKNKKIDVSLQSLSLAIEGQIRYEIEENNDNLPYYCFPLFDVNEQSLYINKEFLDKKLSSFQNDLSENEINKIKDIINNKDPRKGYLYWDKLDKKTITLIFTDACVVFDEGFDLRDLFNEFCKKYKIDREVYKNVTVELQNNGIETKKDISIITEGVINIWGTGTIQSYFLDSKDYDYNNKVIKLCTGKDFGVHSPNGLVVSKSFFDNNVDIFRRLSDMWFLSMNFLRSYLHYVLKKKNPKPYDARNVFAILHQFNKELDINYIKKDLEVDTHFLKEFIIDIDPELDKINSSFFLTLEDANHYTFNNPDVLKSVIKQVKENFPEYDTEKIKKIFFNINPHYDNSNKKLLEKNLYLTTWDK